MAIVRFDFHEMTDNELVSHIYAHTRHADDEIDQHGSWDNAAVAVSERQAERALEELKKRDPIRARAIGTELGWKD